MTALLFSSLDAQEFRGGICPPFYLYDEHGEIINPVTSQNINQPYSPKQTCGKCHDYEKITKGYHFQKGKGKVAPAFMQNRYRWVSTPGNYGGTWCSPAPVYRSLAQKKNEKARQIDMTSFDFITATCGYCHPGGGPAELDREGKRYDQHMADLSSQMMPGGDNGLDGDYYKAFWSETGVLEADCMLCHLPEYNQKERQHQIDVWNFRWAATAGARLAKVEGSVKDKIYPENRVHSAWPGIEEEGKPGLNQPFMKDVFTMWQRHLKEPSQFPQLDKIRDDNGDGMPEVNRDEEIDAIILSVRDYLRQSGFDLTGKRVVWVNNDLVYYSSQEHKQLAKEIFEASPYASVYKYSHDIYPAQAALGVNGCLDCHSTRSAFFTSKVVQYPLADNGKPVYTTQYKLMGLSPLAVYASLWRETYLKPIFYLGMIILFILLLAGIGKNYMSTLLPSAMLRRILIPGVALVIALAIGFFYIAAPELSAYMLPSRLQLDANHFYLAIAALILAIMALVGFPAIKGRYSHAAETMRLLGWLSMALVVVCGCGMLFSSGRWWYTLFDFGLVFMLLATIKALVVTSWQEA